MFLLCRGLAAFLLFTAACGSDTDGSADAGADPGALILVSYSGTVGVLLDDLPVALRDRGANVALALPDSAWRERAARQISAMRMRLTYRRWLALADGSLKAQLPLPPRELWQIELAAAGPVRTTIDGHDIVAIDYTMSGTLLTKPDLIYLTEEALDPIGGVWNEPFTLPVDPDMLFQRTGYACMREPVTSGASSVDSQNALLFFDHSCQASSDVSAAECHYSIESWPVDCLIALRDEVGAIDSPLRFERLPWDAALADQVRVVDNPPPTPDLEVVGAGLDTNRVIYRYFDPSSCAIVESCVGGSGWRRLLQFDASVKNMGAAPLHLGNPSGAELSSHNVFEHSACHDHSHFRFYGDFTVGTDTRGDKRAFCLLSTTRYSNNEQTPLSTDYDGCNYQGIEAGWGDDYFAGLDCQWVDITDLDTSAGALEVPLTFVSNPDRFLCEGTPVTTESGELEFESTSFTTELGEAIDRPMCDFMADHDANNSASTTVLIPQRGGFITQPCSLDQLGPRRDCGFAENTNPTQCTTGETVQLSCTVADGSRPQLLRICEWSERFGSGTSCSYPDALATGVVDGSGITVSFTCPLPRDVTEPGGAVTLYGAAVFDSDGSQAIDCVALP